MPSLVRSNGLLMFDVFIPSTVQISFYNSRKWAKYRKYYSLTNDPDHRWGNANILLPKNKAKGNGVFFAQQKDEEFFSNKS